MSQLFIMLVGFSRSGKTTLAKEIEGDFPNKFTRIDADTIHDFLNSTYPVFSDDKTISGRSFELRQKATRAIREDIIKVLLQGGHSVILDSTNLARNDREKTILEVEKINSQIVTVIVETEIIEEELLNRLHTEDKRNIARGDKPTWVDLYEKIQKPKYEKVLNNEADHVLHCSNSDQVTEFIRKI